MQRKNVFTLTELRERQLHRKKCKKEGKKKERKKEWREERGTENKTGRKIWDSVLTERKGRVKQGIINIVN